MIWIGSRSSSNRRRTAIWCVRSASFSSRLISTSRFGDTPAALERFQRLHNLIGGGHDDARQLARFSSHQP
jgi:hypothetical protein